MERDPQHEPTSSGYPAMLETSICSGQTPEGSPRFHAAFFEHTEDLIYVLDLEHRFIYANRALLDVWGKSWEEVDSKDFHELRYEPWLADFLSAEVDRVAASGRARRGEVPYSGTPGLRQYEYVFSPISGDDGKVQAIFGITRDITERKDAEKQASLVSDLSRKLVAISSGMDIIRAAVEAVGSFLRCDRCYFVECFVGEDRLVVSENWTCEGTASLQGEFKLSDFGGPDWWLEYSSGDFSVEDVATHPLTRSRASSYEALPVRSYMTQPFKREGQRTVVLGATDNTPRKWTKENLSLLENVVARVWPLVEQARDAELRQKLVDDLREADRRKDHFLATLAHELRNPLAPVLTGLEVIESSPTDPALITKVSGMIQRQIRQMVDLIDDLLEISRIKTGKIVLKKSSQSLTRLLKSAIESTEQLITENRHSLVIRLPAGDAFVEVDPSRLAQIVTNLLSNAARYTPPGGEITLEAGIDGAGAWIRVRDNGQGIDPEEQSMIFELFHQTKVGTAQGLGVGLTLVKTLVELHGGTISVHSGGKDQGSEFTVHLPGCVTEPEENPYPATLQLSARGHRKVLVVDDGKNAADILAMFFELEGMEVAVAYDGLSALETAKEFLPDLVVMDLGMPHMDGFEAARLMSEWDSGIRLVALSGWGRDEDKKRSAEAGFCFHLVKPVTPGCLREMLDGFAAS